MDIPFVRIFGTLCSTVWIVALVVNFIVVIKNELATLEEKRSKDKWLLSECEDPVFSAHMQYYNDPCTHVRHRMTMNIHIVAFHRALDQVFLCGSYSCEGLTWMLLDKVRSNLILFFSIFVFLLILVPTLVLPVWKRWTDHLAETHIRDNFNMPYGFNSALVSGRGSYGGHNSSGDMYGAGMHPKYAQPRSFPQQRVLLNAS
jgi:hypothetical protein